jgi:basic membrane lipoprotein Med (substrate-binding protein (PBP1-ABC) superfamily)
MTEKKVDRRGYMKYAGAAIVVVAGGAAGAYYASRPGTPTSTETSTAAATSEATTEKVLKIHAVHYGIHNEGAWEPGIYESLVAAIDAVKPKYNYELSISEGVSSEAADNVIETAAGGNDIVYATTNVYDSTVRKVAPRFPDVKFILESDPIGRNPKNIVSSTEYPQNVIILGPGSLENDYVIGALVAKLIGASAGFGFVQALDIPSGVHPGAMARAGAQSVYPTIKAYQSIIGDFVSPVKCRDAVKAMASLGAKCVFVNQDDTSGLQEATADKIYAIADYKDLTMLYPDTIICSSVWNWQPGLEAILNAVGGGTWDNLRSTDWYWEMTLANGGQGFGHFGNMVTDEDKAFVNDLVTKITSGQLDLPYLDKW